MLIIRPVNRNDLDKLMDLIDHAGYGLTSLPRDREVIKKRIDLSVRSFEHVEKDRPSGELYLFVMEEIFQSKIVGVSGIVSKIGGFDPFYFYKLDSQKSFSKTLNVENEVTTLNVHKVYDGPAEICSLFLSPEWRNSQNGRFLSLSRFLYMSNHIEFFEKEVIAEMRGRVDDNGHSPFWEAVGKKFFKISFSEADFLTMKTKSFIEALLPKYPIIKELLPEPAQEVIGKVHENTEPALRILQKEGFEISNLVGVFEPGPVVKVKVSDIRTIQKAKIGKLTEIGELEETSEAPVIISKIDPKDFQACLGHVLVTKEGIKVSSLTATTLNLKIGDEVKYVTLKG